MLRARPVLTGVIVLLLGAAVSHGQTRTESSNQCGPANPGGPCSTSRSVPCFNSNGRCVSTEQLCSFDAIPGSECPGGVCQADGSCKANSTGSPDLSTVTTTDCATSGCPSNQRCVAARCVVGPTPRRTGCSVSPGGRI